MKKYEGMFLFDPTVSTEWDAMQTELTRLLDRAGARVITLNKWDERRLAYEIRGRKRGTYALTFFEADQKKIADLERDVQLSESILRCMVLSAEHLTEDEMKEIAARPADHSLAEAERIGNRGGYGGGGGGGRDRRPRREEGAAEGAAPVKTPEAEKAEG